MHHLRKDHGLQVHADMTGMPVVLSQEVESVLVGAVILGAGASGDFTSVPEAMARMSKVGKVVFPRLEDKRYYDKKYEVFLKLVEHRKEHAAIVQGDLTDPAGASARRFGDIPLGTSVFLSYIQDPLGITVSLLYHLLIKTTEMCAKDK
ncbi:FGGY carbohydrate kinase domain-containing protein-like [Panthera tigris]|uniref:FGGY carbohydrate kinase domain-containing protein-like n=1 Tax=Panthera tigris TaxID=9694 RepID=UPI001C6F8A2D|nr:FGGY carbohydrate kinase domain-containing protein-like [Panthera tigris]